MQRLMSIVLIVALLPLLAAQPARAQGTPGACNTGTLPSGALWKICVPSSGWNGELFVWAHGYVSPTETELTFANEALPDGTPLPFAIQALGYAYATTSYRKNGLAIVEGVADVRQLVATFRTDYGTPNQAYIVGFSEGGLVATLLAEQAPELFSGALAGCAPIGDFRRQLDYLGDMRVLFDYFFPGVLPPTPISIPQAVLDTWDSNYVPAITNAINGNTTKTSQLQATSGATLNPDDQANAVLNVLWYNAFGTNDAKTTLGGNPYNNQNPRRTYTGSANDSTLNASVQRFSAAPAALSALNAYQTSGIPKMPLVTIHTDGDEVIPIWHEELYRQKAASAGRQITQATINAYGHCNFTSAQVTAAFQTLVTQVKNRRVYLPGVRRG